MADFTIRYYYMRIGGLRGRTGRRRQAAACFVASGPDGHSELIRFQRPRPAGGHHQAWQRQPKLR